MAEPFAPLKSPFGAKPSSLAGPVPTAGADEDLESIFAGIDQEGLSPIQIAQADQTVQGAQAEPSLEEIFQGMGEEESREEFLTADHRYMRPSNIRLC